MIEYRLIPLMVSVVKIGDELSGGSFNCWGLGAAGKTDKRLPDRISYAGSDAAHTVRALRRCVSAAKVSVKQGREKK